jgi:hypothetical protein
MVESGGEERLARAVVIVMRACGMDGAAALPGASQHAPDVRVCARGSDGVANYKGVALMTSAGPVTASIPNAHVA